MCKSMDSMVIRLRVQNTLQMEICSLALFFGSSFGFQTVLSPNKDLSSRQF